MQIYTGQIRYCKLYVFKCNGIYKSYVTTKAITVKPVCGFFGSCLERRHKTKEEQTAQITGLDSKG